MNMTRQSWSRTERASDSFSSTGLKNLSMRDDVRRLLELSPHSVNDDSPLVSPEGVGCPDVVSMSNPVGETLKNTPYHTNPIIGDLTFTKRLTPTQPSAAGRLNSRLRPEDDILYQWRLRRKLEQSGNSIQLSALQTSAPLSTHGSLLQVASNKLASRDCSSNTVGYSEQSPFPLTYPHPTESQVPQRHQTSLNTSHFGHVVPCFPQNTPHVYPTDSHAQPFQNSSSGPLSGLPLPTEQQTKNTSDNRPNRSSSFSEERVPKSKEGRCAVPRKNEKDRKPAAAEQKREAANEIKRRNEASSSKTKSSRHVRHESQNRKTQPDEALRRASQKEMRAKQQTTPRNEKPKKALARSHSPIRSAVGMVVSEVCFPRAQLSDSPSLSATDYSEDGQSFLPQTSSTPHGLQRPSEIIEKLLQEADDSEESDFENDSVLQVLREQRRSVKQRICEIDVLLEAWKKTQPR